MNYLKTDFLWDFIPLLPVNFFPMYRKRHYLFYLLKMIRINKGFEVFDVPKIMIQVKAAYNRKLQRIIDGDHKLANNIYLDNNKIEEILLISYSLRILKLVIIIGNVCYLLAIFWIIGC